MGAMDSADGSLWSMGRQTRSQAGSFRISRYPISIVKAYTPNLQPLLELRIFRLSLLQNGDFRIGILPQREEILISGFCLCCVSGQNIGSPQLQARQNSDRIASHDSPMIDNLLELRAGFGALMRTQISLAAHVHRIECAEESL